MCAVTRVLVPDAQFEEHHPQCEQDLCAIRVGNVCAKVPEALADLRFQQRQEFLVQEFGVDLSNAKLGTRPAAALDRIPCA